MTALSCKNPACGKPRRRRPSGKGYEGAYGWCGPCYQRWEYAGRPPSGPPAAYQAQTKPEPECTSCGRVRRRRAGGGFQGAGGLCWACLTAQRGRKRTAPKPPPDPYDITWAAGEPQRRTARARPFAAALARCWQADDAEGVDRLRAKFISKAGVDDWRALLSVVAQWQQEGKAA